MATDKTKNKRGLLYAVGLILLSCAILGITQCSDSSAYTFNPEAFNIKIVIPIVVLAFGGLMFYLWKKDQ